MGDEEETVDDCWIVSSKGRSLDDSYIRGDIIGRGSSSTVYKCLLKGKTELACKVINKCRLNRNQVQKDIGTLLKLRHPHILQIREILETPTELQVVMELAIGGELLERLAEMGQYSETDAATALRQIIQGVQYIHSHNIVHGDLKPENILYDTVFENAKIKLADCGFSQLLHRDHRSIAYSAPEVLLQKENTAASDLWSFGVVMYIMLCGFEPFWDSTGDVGIFGRVIQGEVTFPSPWWDDISDSAKDLISQLLQVNPEERPTVTEVLNHPWVRGETCRWDNMDSTIKRLREFNAKRKFKAATHAVLATQRAKFLISPEKKPPQTLEQTI